MWSLLVVCILAAAQVAQASDVLSCKQEGTDLILRNPYIQVLVDTTKGHITSFRGTLEGKDVANAKDSVKTSKEGGFVLETSEDGNVQKSSLVIAGELKVTRTGDCSFTLEGIKDTASNALVEETWTVALRAESRVLTVSIQGKTLRSGNVDFIRHSLYVDGFGTYGFFDQGVVQMMDSSPGQQSLASKSTLKRWYAIGGRSSMEVRLGNASAASSIVLQNTDCCDPKYKTGKVPIEQAFITEQAKKYPFHSALSVHLVGEPKVLDTWTTMTYTPSPVVTGTAYSMVWKMAPMDGDFPAYDLRTGENLPETRELVTAIYSSPVGSMRTYFTPGASTPTIWRPEPSYGGSFNFFDPDCFLTISSLMYSGDAYVQAQARSILDETVKGIQEDGQIPHHSEPSKGPVYLAISGAKLPGPNVFWSLGALRYADSSGDHKWLQEMMPKLAKAVEYLTNSLDPATGLLRAAGPLMIDVFIREGLTSDGNAGAALLFNKMADAYDFFGQSVKAAKLRTIVEKMTAAYNKLLWSPEGDHYVTAVESDGTVIKDMVDYDSNLLAVASGLAPQDRAKQILGRIDKGKCAHNHGGTFVSEKIYTTKHVYGGDMGDSETSMARIAYFDALSRRRVGDQAFFDDVLLAPMMEDLMEFLWLNERMGCDGKRRRGYGFIFYPAVISMLLREVRYGIHINLGSVVIDPFGPSAFNYHLGNVHVDYSSTSVRLQTPGSTLFTAADDKRRSYVIRGIKSGTKFFVSITHMTKTTTSTACAGIDAIEVDSSSSGELQFELPFLSQACQILASTTKSSSSSSSSLRAAAKAGQTVVVEGEDKDENEMENDSWAVAKWNADEDEDEDSWGTVAWSIVADDVDYFKSTLVADDGSHAEHAGGEDGDKNDRDEADHSWMDVDWNIAGAEEVVPPESATSTIPTIPIKPAQLNFADVGEGAEEEGEEEKEDEMGVSQPAPASRMKSKSKSAHHDFNKFMSLTKRQSDHPRHKISNNSLSAPVFLAIFALLFVVLMKRCCKRTTTRPRP